MYLILGVSSPSTIFIQKYQGKTPSPNSIFYHTTPFIILNLVQGNLMKLCRGSTLLSEHSFIKTTPLISFHYKAKQNNIRYVFPITWNFGQVRKIFDFMKTKMCEKKLSCNTKSMQQRKYENFVGTLHSKFNGLQNYAKCCSISNANIKEHNNRKLGQYVHERGQYFHLLTSYKVNICIILINS